MAYRFITALSPAFRKWREFADANKIPKWWRVALEEGRESGFWYVYESGDFPIFEIPTGVEVSRGGQWRKL